MPCYKCPNGKWKYGERGRCQFETLKACRAAEAAIHAREKPKKDITNADSTTKGDCGGSGGCENCGCEDCKNKS